jgi:hypothetical protein
MRTKTRKAIVKAQDSEGEYLAVTAGSEVGRGAVIQAFESHRRRDGSQRRFDTWDIARSPEE